jgi:tetratricopeptide (TPR) repeat protein
LLSVKESYKYLLLLGLLLIAANCSVEKNTRATRFYHGMTAKYNIYFNGYESFKEGVDKITNGRADDYAEILNVFEYSAPSSASLCISDMNNAIQKASKLISLKSITAKPEVKDRNDLSPQEEELFNKKEYNKWVDDSYLLIGMARFYKHEFNEASSVFEYCITQANDPLIRKEASVWLARLHNEKGNYSDSYRILNEFDTSEPFPRALRTMYYTTFADLYVKQDRYSEAIDPLNKALDYMSGKHTKYRLTYLLAQLNQQTGNTQNAISLYRKVVKMNPPYDVEFNARINIAGVFDVNSGDPGEMKKEMEKMLKDSKNKDYHDQIYYALGNLSMKEENEKEALEYYSKSVRSSTTNQNQRGRSYLALAEYYYNKNELLKAGRYYDSTVLFLDNDHADYQALKLKSENLNSVVSQLSIIETEDSLQRIAAMSESERDAFIASIINEITEAENEGRTSQYSDRYNLGQFYENERRFQDNIEQEGKWYFYNQTALTFGRTEFRRRWGDRELEDNWRRQNKRTTSSSMTASEDDETIQNGPDTLNTGTLDYKSPGFYLKDLPLTDSLLAVSDNRIAYAYLNAGKAYAEKIRDFDGAVESFESLITRYPENELVPEALYNLYKVNQEIDNSAAENYKQQLINDYPETEFAKMISDPDYYNKKLADQKIAEKLYQEAYNTYGDEDFNKAIVLCDEALKKYEQHQLAPKFLLLRAYSIAHTSDERTLKDELNNIIKLWPGSEESKKAAELTAFINKKVPELKIEEEKEIAGELYIVDTTLNHIFILIIENPAFNINQAAFDVISFNIDNYTNLNYRTEGTLVDNKYILIKVSGFEEYSDAMDYYRSFSADEPVRNPSDSRMYSFIINDDNLRVLNEDKNPERYLLFFTDNYQK